MQISRANIWNYGHGVYNRMRPTIAVRIAMQYPEQVCGLVLVAPSLDPDLEKPRWYNKLAASPLVRWMIPNKMQLANE